MPRLRPLPGFARRSATALVVLSALALGACGGGGGDDTPDGGSSGETPSASLNALAGDWVQKGCVATGGQSYKKMLRARVTGANTLDYYEGVFTFGGSECAGGGRLTGPSKLGTLSFDRSEAGAGVAAHWGVYRTVIGTRHGAIWALRSPPLLCLLGDEIPSIQPTLSAVSASLATVPADNCFVR
jgi:hypothetical protein